MSYEVMKAALYALQSYANGNTSPDRAVDVIPRLEIAIEASGRSRAHYGLTIAQEPKYTVNFYGRIVNRATGIAIPDDEPVMIFRAKDVHVRPTVRRYVDLVNEAAGSGTSHHKDICFERYQQFVTFAEQHPERMKEPDTQA